MGTPGPEEATVDSPSRFSRPWLAFAIGVPLAWAVLLWFHPDVDRNHVYADLRDDVVRTRSSTSGRWSSSG